MGKLTSRRRAELAARFGDRAAFGRAAARRYGGRGDGLAGLLRWWLGRGVPEAAVRPETEAEVVDLVRWAAAHGLPLTPCGRGTSWYGGSVPVHGGVVVDFRRMSRVLAVDAAARTATVQAGILWRKLDRKLARDDLTLRLYPTSYHGSTAGGWLAQGGAGLGSFEAGWFRENVLRARVVLSDGAVWELRDRDVDLVADAEGTTGLITELTVRVQPRQGPELLAVACPDAPALEHLIFLMTNERVPVWSLAFLTPPLVRRLNQAAAGAPPLPEAHVATLAYRAAYRGLVLAALPNLLGPCQAERLPDHAAHSLWNRRFEWDRLASRGPGAVPADAVVPLSALGDFVNAVERQFGQPLAVRGVVVRGAGAGVPEAALHGFRADDPRGAGARFARELVAVAEEHGGRPYGTGLYFARHATKALGARQANRLSAFKRQEDPAGLFNPGKLFAERAAPVRPLARLLRPLACLFGGNTPREHAQ